jgi:hypothetical protein
MFSVKRFADPDFHTVGFGIFDQHPNPSCGLQDRPVPTDKLEGGNETQEGSKPGLHGGVVSVSCQCQLSVGRLNSRLFAILIESPNRHSLDVRTDTDASHCLISLRGSRRRRYLR